MTIPSDQQLYGLIGYPVKHSFSHMMHNAAFAHYGLSATYALFEVAPQDLESFFKKTAVEKKLRGFNVTVPHKENAVKFLNGKVDISVAMNSAVNTVKVEVDGTLSGFNTDGTGFLWDLKERGVALSGKKIALLGAGGGAKAVATALAGEKPKKLSVFDADPSRSQKLAGILKQFFPALSVDMVEGPEALGVADADVLINATPVGMKETDPLLIKKEWFHQDLFVYDLIYNPQESKLLKTAREAGCSCANGLGMLLYQGARAFEIWTAKTAPVEIMRQALSGGAPWLK